MYRANNKLDQWVEQAHVDHDTEEQDREHQHRRGRCDGLDAVEHHRSNLGGGKSAQKRKPYGNQDQRSQHGHALGHNKRHKRDDHREGLNCEAGKGN